MKKQVSIKVYMDEDLYHFYNSIADGSKGQLIRDALQIYRDLSSISSARTLIEVKAEIRQGFDKIERLLKASSSIRYHQQEKQITTDHADGQPDMSDMFDSFVQLTED